MQQTDKESLIVEQQVPLSHYIQPRESEAQLVTHILKEKTKFAYQVTGGRDVTVSILDVTNSCSLPPCFREASRKPGQ